MKTYAILYYNFIGDVAVLTVPGIDCQDAKEYAINNYSHLIEEKNIITAVRV